MDQNTVEQTGTPAMEGGSLQHPRHAHIEGEVTITQTEENVGGEGLRETKETLH